MPATREAADSNSLSPSAEPVSGSTACSGCGISPTTLPAALLTPAMSRAEPLKFVPGRVAERRPGRWPPSRRAPGRAPSSGPSGAWPGWTAARRRSHARVHVVPAFTTSSSTWRQTKRSEVLGSSAPGSRPASHRTWKPLQMPSTRPPRRAKRSTSSITGEKRAMAPDAQVVAVGEAAGDDHRVDALQVAVAVPEQHRLAHALGGAQRVDARRRSRGSGRRRTSRRAPRIS